MSTHVMGRHLFFAYIEAGMRHLIILFSLLLPSCWLLAQPAGTLSGRVTDSAGGKPLGGVSVFLNSTSRGTVTRDDGTFTLAIPKGSYQLIFSTGGSSTAVADINGSHLPPVMNIRLHETATELAAITVEPFDKHG